VTVIGPIAAWDGGRAISPTWPGTSGRGLAEPGDQAGLVSVLRRLAEDEELRARLSMAARQRAAAFPTWEQTARQFFAAVREAADRTATRRLLEAR
jgi:glycosyltransferase involved in cell wall biosynthesis